MELTSRQASLVRNAILTEAMRARRNSEISDPQNNKEFWIAQEKELLDIHNTLLSHVGVIIP